MLIFFSVLSLLCIIGYFLLFTKLIPESLPVKFEVVWWVRPVLALVLLILISLCWATDDSYYYDDIYIPLVLMTLSLILLIIALTEIFINLKLLHHRMKIEIIEELGKTERSFSELEETRKKNIEEQQKIKQAKNLINNKHIELSNLQFLLKGKEATLSKEKGEIDLVINKKLKIKEVELQNRFNNELNEFMETISVKMEDKFIEKKKNLVSNIFTFESNEEDGFYEMKQASERFKKKEEDLEKSKFIQEVTDKVIEAREHSLKSNEHALRAKHTAYDIKSENVDLKSEIDSLAKDLIHGFDKAKLERESADKEIQYKFESELSKEKSEREKSDKKLEYDFNMELSKEKHERKSSDQELKNEFQKGLSEEKYERQLSDNNEKHERINSDKDLKHEFETGLSKERHQTEIAINKLFSMLELEQEKRQSDKKEILSNLVTMEARNDSKIAELKSSFSITLNELESKTIKTFSDLKDKISKINLKYGQEIMRLDGQQSRILTELEKYYNKSQKFVNECKNLAIEAREQNLKSDQLFNKVNNLYEKYKSNSDEIESKLRSSLEQVAVKNGELANTIGESMLRLKNISDDQYLAMKDLSLENKKVDAIWKEKNADYEKNLQELKHSKEKVEHTRDLLNSERQTFNKEKQYADRNSKLRHELHMHKEQYKEEMEKVIKHRDWLNSYSQNYRN